MKSILLLSLRLTSAATFLYAAALMLMSGSEGLFRLVEYYNVPWISADIVLRILVLLLLFAGSFDFFGIRIKLSKAAKWLITLFASIDIVLKLTTAPLHDLVFFPSLHIIPAVLLVLVFLIRSVFTYFEQTKPPRKKWFVPVLIIACVGITFLRPIYIQDWSTPKTIDIPEYIEKSDSLYSERFNRDRKEPLLAAVFTTGCPYCKATAKKMGIAARRGDLGESLILFTGEEEKAEAFIKENNAEEVPYMVIDKQLLLNLSRGRFPTLYYISRESEIYFMRGSTALNPIILDIISEEKKKTNS